MPVTIADQTGAPAKAARRRAAFSLASLAGLSFVVLFGVWLLVAAGPPPSAQAPAPGFSLHGLDGGRVELASLRGRPFAMFFGFTNCPVVCPTTMREISDWLADLGEEGRDFRVYFVTLDPARDTPEKLRDYLGYFSPRLVGLTGSDAEVAAAAKTLAVYYRKIPTSSGYTLEHSALIYLFDAQGFMRGQLVYGGDRGAALVKLRALIGGK